MPHNHLDILLDPALNPANFLPDDLRDALIARLKEAAERISPDLSLNEFCAATGIEHGTVRRRFPRWSEFREAAGLTPEPRRRGWGTYDTERLRDTFLQFVAEQGEHVTLHEFCRHACVAPATISRHFGGFANLRCQAGLQPNPPGRNRYSDEEILGFYDQVVQQLGRSPTAADFNRLAPISSQTLRMRIGTKSEVERRYRKYKRTRNHQSG